MPGHTTPYRVQTDEDEEIQKKFYEDNPGPKDFVDEMSLKFASNKAKKYRPEEKVSDTLLNPKTYEKAAKETGKAVTETYKGALEKRAEIIKKNKGVQKFRRTMDEAGKKIKSDTRALGEAAKNVGITAATAPIKAATRAVRKEMERRNNPNLSPKERWPEGVVIDKLANPKTYIEGAKTAKNRIALAATRAKKETRKLRDNTKAGIFSRLGKDTKKDTTLEILYKNKLDDWINIAKTNIINTYPELNNRPERLTELKYILDNINKSYSNLENVINGVDEADEKLRVGGSLTKVEEWETVQIENLENLRTKYKNVVDIDNEINECKYSITALSNFIDPKGSGSNTIGRDFSISSEA